MEKLKKKMENHNLKVLLVLPRYTFSNKPVYLYSFPLGIAYISAVLKKANYDVTCLNVNHLEGLTGDIVKAELDKKKYDIVATGHMGIGYPMVESILEAARAHRSKPKTILGGAIITSEPELIFNALKPDFGVIGEGEVTTVDLLNSIEKKKDLKKVKGIMLRDEKGKIIITPPRPPIKNIDTIPFPDLEGFDIKQRFDHAYSCFDYSDTFNDYPRNYLILASRGCPFHCTFCYHTLGEQYRERSIKNVIKELKWAVDKYKINSFFLNDDLFSYKKERIYEFCREIKKLSVYAGYKIVWACQLSVLHVDRELLRTMKDAGCGVIGFGFESYSKEVLKSMKKPITPELIDKVIKMMMEEKIGIIGNFIFGDVAETAKTAKETIDYWKKNCKEQVLLAFIQPFNGSEIYDHCIRKGLIKDKLDFIKNQLPKQLTIRNALNMTENMNEKEFNELKNTIASLNANLTHTAEPIHIKKMANGRYEVLTKCPFCHEKTLYKNFYLTKRYLYRPYIFCRKCNMGYYLISPIISILRKLNLLWFFEKVYYESVRRIFKITNNFKPTKKIRTLEGSH
jgi:radical SAM superfamily enzyme YgiQ (UPF0313 family)